MSTEEAPRVRSGHTAVWTGKEMIIWSQDGVPGAGGRYDPATDTWAAVSLVNAPRTVGGYSAIWTDKEMIIWGGWAGGTEFLNTGGRYDPATDTWVATNTVNAPIRRDNHTAVWTGSEMIIWGGDTVGVTYMSTNTGGRYNPATDTWTGTSTTNAPSPRDFHTAVWTGTEMLVWGGGSLDTLDTGGRYDPATNTWAATSRDNVPSHRRGHTAVGTDTEMIVWGGFYVYFDPVQGDYVRGVLNTGSRYCASAANPIVPLSPARMSAGKLVEGAARARNVQKPIRQDRVEHWLPLGGRRHEVRLKAAKDIPGSIQLHGLPMDHKIRILFFLCHEDMVEAVDQRRSVVERHPRLRVKSDSA